MKSKIIVYSVCIFVLTILQSTMLNYITIAGIKPNLLIVFIVSVSLIRGNVEGMTVGLFSGLVQDILCGSSLGFYGLLGLYLGLVVGSVNKRLYRENLLVIIVFTFASTIVYESAVYFLSVFWSGRTSIPNAFGNIIMPETIYNIVVSLFVYVFIIKISDQFNESDKNTRRY